MSDTVGLRVPHEVSAPPDSDSGERRVPAWQLVAVREITVKLTDKTFVLSTTLMVALLAGLFGVQIFLANRTTTTTVIATPDSVVMARSLAEQAPHLDDTLVVNVEQTSDAAAARAAVDGGEADAWLHTGSQGWVLTTRSEPDDTLFSVTSRVIRDETLRANAAAAGTTPEQLEAGSAVQTDLLRGDAQQAQLAEAVGFAFAFLFYLAALLFGVSLASSVLEEKQSRIVEIIATAVPVRHLLAGKVIGNTAIAMGQLVVYAGVGLIGLSFTDYSTYVPSLSGPVVAFLVFFLAGFTALACLWAVAGSLANRQEDLQATTGPLTFLTIAVFFGALTLDGRWATVASFVPPLSAVLMPIRLLKDQASYGEAAIALALLLATAAVTIRVGERLYRRSLLQTGGGRISLRSAWRSTV